MLVWNIGEDNIVQLKLYNQQQDVANIVDEKIMMMKMMTMMTTLNIKVVAEEEPGLGDEKINYQEYVVPAFLTQVGHEHKQIGADRGEVVQITKIRMERELY